MACCPIPGLIFACTPGTTLISLRFEDPAPISMCEVPTKASASPRAKGTVFYFCMTCTLFSFSFVDKAERHLAIPGLFFGKPGTSLITRRFPSEPKREPAQKAPLFGGLKGGVGESRAEKLARLGREKAQDAAKKDQQPSKDRPAYIPKQGAFNNIFYVIV